MPIGIRQTHTGGQTYVTPFVGPIDHTGPIRLDVSSLDGTDFVDEFGFIIPGTPLTAAGVPASAAAGAGTAAVGCVPEAIRVAPSGASADLAAAADFDIAVAHICQINRDALEDNIGRALTADEVTNLTSLGRIVLIA